MRSPPRSLRDGEQSPGASITKEEKLRIARQLERMRVDVLYVLGRHAPDHRWLGSEALTRRRTQVDCSLRVHSQNESNRFRAIVLYRLDVWGAP
ncbi:hypothetical protein [Paraburkholderia nodosa]|uniref:hypothetical protein n=1 Tax=Paraburkholderia nodosa TaxID=392320 RepID=UPI00210BD461|nr:hypothetical protein [Paraburkholderia nodosa]